MKNQITLLLVLFTIIQINAQQKNIFTKSVKIDEFIPFIVANYKKDLDSIKTKNIVFLIPISDVNVLTEKNIILKQGFRLLSDKLNEDDMISLVAYGNLNGIILKSTSVKELKKILFSMNNIEKSIAEIVEDGIQLAHDITDANFDENAINSIVLIRDSTINNKKIASFKSKKDRKPRNNAVLLTLISLAPEMIKILKE